MQAICSLKLFFHNLIKELFLLCLATQISSNLGSSLIGLLRISS